MELNKERRKIDGYKDFCIYVYIKSFCNYCCRVVTYVRVVYVRCANLKLIEVINCVLDLLLLHLIEKKHLLIVFSFSHELKANFFPFFLILIYLHMFNKIKIKKYVYTYIKKQMKNILQKKKINKREQNQKNTKTTN